MNDRMVTFTQISFLISVRIPDILLFLCCRPLDTIGSVSNRWSYGFAFGTVSSSVLLLFSERYIPFTVVPWARGTHGFH